MGIRRGFHRLGLVMFGICAAGAVALLVIALFEGTYDRRPLVAATTLVCIGVAFYGLARAIGWRVAGFRRE